MGHETAAVAVAYHSGYGHTARLAAAVASGARAVPETEAVLIDVASMSPEDWQVLDRADAIIFGAPTYMGSASSAFKAFAEATSPVWADGLRWKDKIAAGFTNSQTMNGDKLNTLVGFAILAAQHGMHWVSLGMHPGWATSGGSPDDENRLGAYLGAMAQSNGDEGPDLAPPDSDLRTGQHLGRRVAEVTHQWLRGRVASAVAA